MSQPIKLDVQQNTDAWFNERQRRLGASESPIVLLKQLQWGTPYSLYLEKIKPIGESKRDQADNWATRRGKYFEPKVRARYELFSDLDFPEGSYASTLHPHLMASLDGVNFDTKKILEIKVPSREVYELAQSGKVHEKYQFQLEQQILVMGGDDLEWSVDFVCGRIEKVNGKDELTDHVVVQYKSDPVKRKELLDATHNFWFNHVIPQVPPPLCEEDIVTIEPEKSLTLYQQLQSLVLCLDDATELANKYKKQIKELETEIAKIATHPIVRWGDIQITKRSRVGNVDYKKVPELKGVNLDQYRGKSAEYLDIKLVG